MMPAFRARNLAWALAAGCILFLPACRPSRPYQASQSAARLDEQIDWREARLLVVQDGGRYKTLESFARESLAALSGREHLPGLSPLASLFEWLFNRDAYLDVPVIPVRNPGLRARLVQPLSEDRRQRILREHRFTPRELADPALDRLLAEMESRATTRGAVNRVRTAQALAERLEQFLTIVPQPGGDAVAPWFTPLQVLANLSDEQLRELGLSRGDLPLEARRPLPGITPQHALAVTVAWTSLRAAWLRGQPGEVQRYLDRLTQLLPTLAPPGLYPDRSQRLAEARYYAAGKFTYGWVLYLLALLVSVAALVTGWRATWAITIVLLLAGLALHAYGVSLRWYILGRIPVANTFEAVVASAAAGIAIVVLLEVFLGTRVLLVGASATGFWALLMGQYVLPGSELSAIPAILDDVQLRLHTVLIITAYALIFLAAVVAGVYLIGYYGLRLSRSGRPWEPAHGVDQPASRPSQPRIDYPSSHAEAQRQSAIEPERQRGAATVVSSPGEIRCGRRGAPAGREGLPGWLDNIDSSHLIILNMVFVLLFVGGIVLGAWWADYSWGRPWGWDPKEVFALNTWLIYTILIHTRFVVRKPGIWTAWLSLAGCAMMAFNWFFVNFFISSVHSYA